MYDNDTFTGVAIPIVSCRLLYVKFKGRAFKGDIYLWRTRGMVCDLTHNSSLNSNLFVFSFQENL